MRAQAGHEINESTRPASGWRRAADSSSDDKEQIMNTPSRKVLLALMLLVAVGSAAEARFAAIAYSPQTGKWAYAHGAGDRATVQNNALDRCNTVDARLAVWVENGWAALAKNAKGAYAWSWSGNSRAEAEASALQKAGPGASIMCWVYSGK
jgi:hypothetical protein